MSAYMNARWPERALLSALAFALALLDQTMKPLMEEFLLRHDGIYTVLPVFDLQLAYNSGAGFGFLADTGRTAQILLLAISALASAALIVWIWLPATGRLAMIGATLVLGGAMGNLYDRMLSRQVIDYLYFHLGEHGFPAFNIADISISAGAVLLALFFWQNGKKT